MCTTEYLDPTANNQYTTNCMTHTAKGIHRQRDQLLLPNMNPHSQHPEVSEKYVWNSIYAMVGHTMLLMTGTKLSPAHTKNMAISQIAIIRTQAGHIWNITHARKQATSAQQCIELTESYLLHAFWLAWLPSM
jgi:hypothetical protein